jgi:glycerol-3-phosphate O-acyltransferase
MDDDRQTVLEDIRHCFDLGFYKQQGVTIGLRMAHFIREVFVCEPEPNDFKNDGSLLCYSSLHKSQLDYLILGRELYKHGYPAPRYIAGKNLFVPSITRDYLKKLGAVCLDRSRVMRRDRLYIRTFTEYLRDDLLQSGENLLFFPEGGRSYDGAIGKPATGIYDTILESARRSGRRTLIVPIALTYDGVVEAASFPLLVRSKMMRYRWQKLLLYYFADLGQLLLQYFRNARVCGDVYIDVQAPVDVADYIDDPRGKVRLAMDVVEAQRRAVRVTSRSILASSLAPLGRTTRTDAEARVRDLLDEIRDRDLPVTRTVAPYLASDVDHARVLSAVVKASANAVIENGTTLHVRRPALMRYYRNTTAHHFESVT